MEIKTLTSIEELKKAIDIFDELPEGEKSSTAKKILEFAKRNNYVIKKESILKYKVDSEFQEEPTKKDSEVEINPSQEDDKKEIKNKNKDKENKDSSNIDSNDGEIESEETAKIELNTEEKEAREKMLAKFRHLGLDRAIPKYIKEEDLIYSTATEPGKYDAYIKWRNNKTKKLEYAYTEQYREEKDKLKFERVKKYTPDLMNNFRANLTNVLRDENSTEKNKEVATILKMLEKTGLRVGDKSHWKSDLYSAEARGISTLQSNNITIDGDRVELNFIGKSNVENACVFFDKEIADYLKDKKEKRANEEFLFSCNKKAIETKYKNLIPVENGVIKDLRTIKANEVAKNLLYNNYMPPAPLPEKDEEIKALVEKKLMNVFDNVSFTINNEPNTSQQWYVDKKHIEDWLNYVKIEPFEIKSAKTKRAEDFIPQKDLFGDKSITEGIEDVKDYSNSGEEESTNNMNDDNKDITYDDLKRKTDELLNFFKQFAKEQDIEIKENNNKSEDDTNFEMFNEDIYSAPEWYQNDKWGFRRTTKERE